MPIDDLAVLDDGVELAHVLDVLGWIGGDDVEVRELAGFNRADILHTEVVGDPLRCRLKNLHRRHLRVVLIDRHLLLKPKTRRRLIDVGRGDHMPARGDDVP